MSTSSAERRSREEVPQSLELQPMLEAKMRPEALHIQAPEMLKTLEHRALQEEAAVGKMLEQDMINQNLDEIARGQVGLLVKKEKGLFGKFLSKVKRLGADVADVVRGRELRQMTEVSDYKKTEVQVAKDSRAIDEFLAGKGGVDAKILNTRRHTESTRQDSKVKIDAYANQKGADMDAKILHQDSRTILENQAAVLAEQANVRAGSETFLVGRSGMDEKVINQSEEAANTRATLRQEARQEKNALVQSNRRQIDKKIAHLPNVDKPVVHMSARKDKFLDTVYNADVTIKPKDKELSFEYVRVALEQQKKERVLSAPQTRDEIFQRLEEDRERNWSAPEYFETLLDRNEADIKALRAEITEATKKVDGDTKFFKSLNDPLADKAILGTLTPMEKMQFEAVKDEYEKAIGAKAYIMEPLQKRMDSLKARNEKFQGILSHLKENDQFDAKIYLANLRDRLNKELATTEDRTTKSFLENNVEQVGYMLENLDLHAKLEEVPENRLADLPSDKTLVTQPAFVKFPPLVSKNPTGASRVIRRPVQRSPRQPHV